MNRLTNHNEKRTLRYKIEETLKNIKNTSNNIINFPII